jgi:hypothetical protein
MQMVSGFAVEALGFSQSASFVGFWQFTFGVEAFSGIARRLVAGAKVLA